MSDTNEEWWKSVHLPKSIKDWETKASSTCFEETIEENQQHESTRQKNRQHINPNKLHQGERAIDVHPTDLSGWDPASKIKKPYYLTTRILWNFKSLSDLTPEGAEPLFNVTQEADDVSRAYLKGLKNWKDFRRDIRNSMHQSRPPMGQAKTLGIFTFVRDQMWAINKTDENPPPDPISSRTRSKITNTTESEGSSQKDVENVTEVSEYRSQVIPSPVEDRMDSDEDRSRPNSRSDAYNESDAGSSDLLMGGSVHSIADTDMYPPTRGEETVNIASVAFLRTVTMGCKQAGLEWEEHRKGFSHRLGEAYIRAYTDGCLSSDRKDDVHGILEVKPFTLTKRPEQTLMQMGIEMLTYMLYCEFNGKQKER